MSGLRLFILRSLIRIRIRLAALWFDYDWNKDLLLVSFRSYGSSFVLFPCKSSDQKTNDSLAINFFWLWFVVIDGFVCFTFSQLLLVIVFYAKCKRKIPRILKKRNKMLKETWPPPPKRRSVRSWPIMFNKSQKRIGMQFKIISLYCVASNTTECCNNIF